MLVRTAVSFNPCLVEPPVRRRAGGSPALFQLIGAALSWLWLAGCYTYVPLIAPPPEPDRVLAFDLNDRGRAEVVDNVGPETARVEGTLLRNTDTDYVIRVARVITLRGRAYPWSGETVTLNRSYVSELREKRFSPPRTLVAAGGATVSLVAFIVTRGLGVFGGDDEIDHT
ncbi:MAG: hypothetical protein ACREN5_17355, partial [Gemmatimonadales bacterium]